MAVAGFVVVMDKPHQQPHRYHVMPSGLDADNHVVQKMTTLELVILSSLRVISARKQQ